MSAKLSTTSSSLTLGSGSLLGVEVMAGVPTPAGAMLAKAACTLAGVIRLVCSAAMPR